MSILEMVIRTTVGFIILYILCRLLNKKLIAQMTFFDFVAGITIGSVVASSMLIPDVPILIGMVGLILFCFYTFLSSLGAIKSFLGRKVLEDEPTYLIKNGEIYEEGLKKVRLTVDALLTGLRKQGFFYIDQVETAYLETDGTITALAKPPYLNAMQKDVQNIQISRGVSQAFIIDGKVLSSSLKLLGKDMTWVRQVLQTYNVPNVEDVFFAQIDELGNVYIDVRDDLPNKDQK
ncbi:DUF421 domain-containing protein [Alkalihalobacterium chitinilyticum]|uniref:DUF421 domain-containing protein n=1 Tax=Alkalihalobacterium chitinilyticum TaxID=2980103 RepID=A0ABT5VL65_9BACI|nr:DUF421 domain-containing protein [Alkalihalobacterium chitinilyticum]MDE5416154.1 DUF421 domain-containing protein [Alkalihalobacterium chitinilyticum]